MEMVERIRGNPLGYLFGALGGALVFLGGIWSMFTGKTIPELWADGGWAAMTICAAIWLILFLFLSTAIIQIRWIRRFRNSANAITPMTFLIVAVAGAAIGVAIWVWLVPSAPDKEQIVTAPYAGNTVTQRRHSERLTPFQIYNKVNSADPLQKESVALALHNGTVEWTLRFLAVKSVKGAPDRIEVGFGDHSTDVNQPVRFEIPRQGHEYFNQFRPQDQHWYRVTGVISEVVLDDDNNFRFIKLADVSFEEASAPPLPGESPSPREVGPKVVPPKKPDLVVEAETGPRVVSPPPKTDNNRTVQGTELQLEISALFKGRTAIRVLELLEPYKGRALEVSGKVSEVKTSSPTQYYVVLKGTPNVGCICFFKPGWEKKLRDLEQDEIIKIRGRFGPNQNGEIIVMDECELVPTTPP